MWQVWQGRSTHVKLESNPSLCPHHVTSSPNLNHGSAPQNPRHWWQIFFGTSTSSRASSRCYSPMPGSSQLSAFPNSRLCPTVLSCETATMPSFKANHAPASQAVANANAKCSRSCSPEILISLRSIPGYIMRWPIPSLLSLVQFTHSGQ